jgi:hypothetical protein
MATRGGRARHRDTATEDLVPGIEISQQGATVTIAIGAESWQGSASQAERLLTALHYALNRARPGTNIASVFLNGKLWGGKLIETDEREAIRGMRATVEQLAEFLASLEEKTQGARNDQS